MLKKAIKDDSLIEMYFRQIKAFPLISFEEEKALSKQIQDGNEDALNKLINSNLRLAAKIAGLYNTPGIPILDLIQEANIGLIQAAKKYDYRKNVKFCTYASWWIRQFVTRYIVNKKRLVRLPQSKEDALKKIQQTYNTLCQKMMKQPNASDIAKELGITVKDVDSIINMASDDCAEGLDIHEDYTYCPERNLMKQASHDGTMRILGSLKERERRIINYRYQLNGCKRHTLREIGNKMNLSAETVRQIEIKALNKIRRNAKELRDWVYEAI